MPSSDKTKARSVEELDPKYLIVTQGRFGYRPYGTMVDAWKCQDPEIMLAGCYESGKGNIISSIVYTPTGPIPIGELRVGDWVLTQDGSPTRVTGVYPQGVKPTYRVTLHDGMSTVVDEDHWWRIGYRKFKRKGENRKRVAGTGYDYYRLVDTKFLLRKRLSWKAGTKKETRRKYWLPTAGPAQFRKRVVTIDPYVMGILISEGSLTSSPVSFSSADREIVDEVTRRVSDAEITAHADGIGYGVAYAEGKSYARRLAGYGLFDKLSYDKFIPDDYLYNCVEYRLDLLRGLMDGDGTVDREKGAVTYTSVSKRLIEDVRLLVEGLGGYVGSVYERPARYTKDGEWVTTGAISYTASVILPSGTNPFFLKRKAELVHRQLEPRRFLDSVEYVGDQETVCISVDHPSHLYLTDHFIVTHNTFGALQKLHGLMMKYPNARALMVRKSYKALIPSALASYYNKVLPKPPGTKGCPVEVYGGGKPDWITYPNGSRIILGGLDNPEKVLSSEYDYIFVPQAEELTLHDWEQLKSRNTGRAGNVPYSQMIGDCNPDVPTHWILNRQALTVFHFRHTDNPMLFKRNSRSELVLDDEGQPVMTEQGERTMRVLNSLSGVRYKRGVLGLWVGAEGQVYEDFDQQIHVVDSIKPQPYWRKFRVFDFGYNHAFVCQFWALDHDDVLYLWKEIYMTGRTVKQHVEGIRGVPGIRQLSYGHDFEANICDWDAEDRATLEEMLNIETTAADKRISTGIEAVQNRLRSGGNGKPRIIFARDAINEIDDELDMKYQPTHTIEEFPAYVWRKLKDGAEQTSKDETPVKQADHGMDAMRYMVAYLDGGTQYGKPKYVRYA